MTAKIAPTRGGVAALSLRRPGAIVHHAPVLAQHRAVRSQHCEESTSDARRVVSGAVAVAAAAAMALSPFPALAVSGGGGISEAMSNRDLSGQDLMKASYTKAILRSTNFTNCKLRGVSFFGALAKGAIFKGADLTGADLESADLEGADLSNAILVGAFVNATQLQGANIEGSDWTDVVLRKDLHDFLCTKAKGTNPTTGVDTAESLVC